MSCKLAGRSDAGTPSKQKVKTERGRGCRKTNCRYLVRLESCRLVDGCNDRVGFAGSDGFDGFDGFVVAGVAGGVAMAPMVAVTAQNWRSLSRKTVLSASEVSAETRWDTKTIR